MSDQKLEGLLSEWKTENALSPARSVAIRQTILDTPVTDSADWWMAQFGALKGILKSSTACLTS